MSETNDPKDTKPKTKLEDFNMGEFMKNSAQIATMTEDLDTKIKGLGILVMLMFAELQKMASFGTEKPVSVDISPAIGMNALDILNDLIGMRTKLKPLEKGDEISPLVLVLQLIEMSVVRQAKDEKAKNDKNDADGPSKAEIDEALKNLERQ